MIDLIGNFKLPIFLGALLALFYVLFNLGHKGEPYSRRVKNDLGAALVGFGVEALFWFALIVLGSKLAESYDIVWQVVMLVIETPLLPVSLVDISTILIPLFFTINEDSDGRYDYRIWALLAVGSGALISGMYYWNVLSTV